MSMPAALQTPRSPRFRELDGLRGLAAVAVVIYHLAGGYQARYPEAPEPPFAASWGAYGVQLFFLISGFVILMTARRAQRPSDFAVSRLSRLYPVYWLAVSLTILVTIIFNVPHTPQGAVERILNYTMVQRWLLVANADDVYWTLAIEMQFYVAVFLLLLLTRSRLSALVVRTASVAWMLVALAVAVWAGPASRGLDPQLVATPVKLVLNVTMAEWAPLFSAGMFAYLARTEDGGRGTHRVLAWASGGLAAVNAALLHSISQGWIVLGIAVVFLVVVQRESTKLLVIRPVQWFGKVSYSLYIGHNVTGAVMITLLWPVVGREMAMVVAFLGVTLIAWGLHEMGEVRGTRILKKALLAWRDRMVPRPTKESLGSSAQSGG